MICSYCDKTALYKVQGRGYCRDHRAEAVEAEKARIGRSKAYILRNYTSLGLRQGNMAAGGGYVKMRTMNALRSKENPATTGRRTDKYLADIRKRKGVA